MNKQTPNAPRPTMEEAKQMLADLGWAPSEGSWEDERRLFVFACESYPGTYGGTAAAVTWSQGWLVTPPRKPANVRFV